MAAGAAGFATVCAPAPCLIVATAHSTAPTNWKPRERRKGLLLIILMSGAPLRGAWRAVKARPTKVNDYRCSHLAQSAFDDELRERRLHLPSGLSDLDDVEVGVANHVHYH